MPSPDVARGPGPDEALLPGADVPAVTAPEAPARQIGDTLRTAREAAGISAEEICFRLKLTASRLAAVEAGELDKLPSMVFARALLRSYARAVGVDIEAPLAALGGVPEQVRLEPLSLTARPAQGRRVIASLAPRNGVSPTLKAAMAGLALLAIALAWLQFSGWRRDKAPATPAQAAVTAAPTAPAPMASPTGSEPAATLAPNPVAAAATVAPASTPIPAPAAAPVAPAHPESAAAIAAKPEVKAEAKADTQSTAADLLLDVHADCWFEIRDQAGHVIATGIARPGEPRRIGAGAPVTLILGNVAAVTSVQYRGKAVELHPEPGRNTLRLTLP